MLILASTSKYRAALLSRLGLPFQAIAPDCDEDAIKAQIPDPRLLATTLARMKAASVAKRFPDAVVIGSDQLAHCGGRILGKPGSRSRAIEQLMSLNGKTHELVTAVAVQKGNTVKEYLDLSLLTMRNLDQAAIERVVDRDQPFDCAGAYKLEAGGITLFSRIECKDHSAITGLPLMALIDLLHGFDLHP